MAGVMDHAVVETGPGLRVHIISAGRAPVQVVVYSGAAVDDAAVRAPGVVVVTVDEAVIGAIGDVGANIAADNAGVRTGTVIAPVEGDIAVAAQVVHAVDGVVVLVHRRAAV